MFVYFVNCIVIGVVLKSWRLCKFLEDFPVVLKFKEMRGKIILKKTILPTAIWPGTYCFYACKCTI